MQSMEQLHDLGMIDDEYMDQLTREMKQEYSIEKFEAHLKKMSGIPDRVFRGSGGNKKIVTAAQRKAKRRAQRKARKVARHA